MHSKYCLEITIQTRNLYKFKIIQLLCCFSVKFYKPTKKGNTSHLNVLVDSFIIMLMAKNLDYFSKLYLLPTRSSSMKNRMSATYLANHNKDPPRSFRVYILIKNLGCSFNLRKTLNLRFRHQRYFLFT